MRKKRPNKLVYKPIIFLIFFIFNSALYANTSITSDALKNTSISQEVTKDSILEFRNLAKQFSDSSQAREAVNYAIKYISATQDLSIINDHFFSTINQSITYVNFKERYKPEFNLLSLFYLFAGFLGIFMFVILNLKKGVKRSNTFLISLFVLLHSLFIIHLSLYVINCQYYFPHTLLMSTVFVLLYGPLIYLYFKKTGKAYKLKWIDVLHFLPAGLLLSYIFPFYKLSSEEKFLIIFNQEDILSMEANFIIVAQIASLVVYAILIVKIYSGKTSNEKDSKSRKRLWQRNLITMYIAYIVAFILFNNSTSGNFNSSLVYHLLILTMVGVVFYVSYITYAQPEIFKGELKLVDPMSLFKYKKSGLTKSFSEELKDQLLTLLEKDKIYKQNNLNLNALAEMLNTNRHNTSQIINEHFNMNFFELVNKFRIDEAVRMINDDKYRDLNIIEIAYEVGYNNKVTFNKSFKKVHSVTPSQFIKAIKSEKKA